LDNVTGSRYELPEIGAVKNACVRVTHGNQTSRKRNLPMNTKRLLIGSAIALASSLSYAATTTEVVCSYAPSQSAAVNRITAAAGGAGAGAAAILQATGLSLVAHSSGGYILTGAGGYVAGTLIGSLVVPVAVVATVVVGGTAIALELSCAPKNHPQAVKGVKDITAEFNKAVRSANEEAIKTRDKSWQKIAELNEGAIVRRDAAIGEVQAANEKAIVIRDHFFAGFFN